MKIQVRGLQSLWLDSAQYGACLIPIFNELKLIVSRKHKEILELDPVLMAVKSKVEDYEHSGIRPTTDKAASRKHPFQELELELQVHC